MIALIGEILDAMLALMGQLVYFENKADNPETIYNDEKQKIDTAIGNHDIAGNDAIIDDLLPPGN